MERDFFYIYIFIYFNAENADVCSGVEISIRMTKTDRRKADSDQH